MILMLGGSLFQVESLCISGYRNVVVSMNGGCRWLAELVPNFRREPTLSFASKLSGVGGWVGDGVSGQYIREYLYCLACEISFPVM
jgi:hypothetical protein